MTPDQLPPYFLPLFAVAFLMNAAYVGSLLLLQRRVANTPAAFDLFSASVGGSVKALSFVFSGRHAALNDAGVSRLVWVTRLLFAVGGVATLSVFALVFSLVRGAA
jgi:hypothetical protein